MKKIKQISVVILLFVSFSKAVENLANKGLILHPQPVLEDIFNRAVIPEEISTYKDPKTGQARCQNIALTCKALALGMRNSDAIYFPKNIDKEKFLVFVAQKTGQKEVVKVKLSQFLKYVPGYLRSKQNNELKNSFYNEFLGDPRLGDYQQWAASDLREHVDLYGHLPKQSFWEKLGSPVSHFIVEPVKYNELGFLIENYRQFEEHLWKLSMLQLAEINNNQNLKRLYDQFKGRKVHTVIKDLLENFADVNARDSYGRTPLFYAITNPRCPSSIVQMLLDYWADVTKINVIGFEKDNRGESARTIAATIRHFYAELNAYDKVVLLEKMKLLDPYLTFRENQQKQNNCSVQ